MEKFRRNFFKNIVLQQLFKVLKGLFDIFVKVQLRI